MQQYEWDYDRHQRTNIGEAVYCESKSVEQIQLILNQHIQNQANVLLTRLSAEQFQLLDADIQQKLDYCAISKTAILQSKSAHLADVSPFFANFKVGIITAGTSDIAVASEVARTLSFNQIHSEMICDVGVAGIHRLLNKIDNIRQFPVLIACAGMEGALFSVLTGLTHAPVIAVPTSVGYGVSKGGKTALESALASCAPGITTVNIDNGFGAACAAIKLAHMCKQWSQ
ncbi:nickel pincer cofactor biosynthesis protein LarB [Catenovulum adriaticum]|uniref:Nickel pincer cofactor biosynthesis protein LarB n=1 Tax=Catenovulum adriaticum TaxID=2984846 RepID=A0ABY7AVC9_9ALTE|nr:nickel pincer cofactor biosynthesis protein LarB [Catenovulum sp. TS8]WAJ72274.1 nickel pincer cofactor biosynthesis protein LarB [Catenovulum sp. TS8]